MFKFNFNIDESSEQTLKNEDKEQVPTSDEISWYDSKETMPTVEQLDLFDMYKLNAKEMQIGNLTLMYMIPKFVLDSKANESEDIQTAEENHTDLIPGVYEGGAKLWECTLDLLNYLKDKEFAWSEKRALDLGCGCGLLGIYALKHGAIAHFQDYNEDVLNSITIPNVLLNLNEELLADTSFNALREKVQFYAGDWRKYVELTSQAEKFDFILTSETIYNPENQKKLLETFASKLNANGKVYVAAKSYYFGVGGNLKQFEDLVKDDGQFSYKTLWTSTDGVQREIIELKFLKKS